MPDSDIATTSENRVYRYNNHAVTGIEHASTGEDRFSFTYDGAGNMVSHFDHSEKREKAMTYDSYNRIKTVANPATSETVGRYWYDDGGFRVRRISRRDVDGTTYEHEILYPSMYMGMEIQRSGDGTVVSGSYTSVNNIYLNGLRVAAMVPTGEVTYYFTDQVDSVRLVADEQGKPVTRTEYYPYGDAWFQEGNTHHAPKYNSQELDRESGLYFYNARYYDSDTGRFVTADNVIDGEFDTQGWNRYAYVKGNPVGAKDPSGNYIGYYHTKIVNESFKNDYKLSEDALKYVLKGNLDTDKGEDAVNINVEATRKHALAGQVIEWRDKNLLPTIRYQTKSEADVSSRKYIDEQVNTAVKYAKEGNYKKALMNVGSATHTAEDRQAHKFEPWTFSQALAAKTFGAIPILNIGLPSLLSHASGDFITTSKELKQNITTTHKIWDTFQSRLIKAVGQKEGKKMMSEIVNFTEKGND